MTKNSNSTLNATKDRKKVRQLSKVDCNNHKSIRAIRYCDNCDQPFCNDCVNVYWTHNFLSYAYLGERKDFKKEYLCKLCMKKKRRKNLFLSGGVLFLLLIFILASIYNYTS
ncbi:MAG: B-box zinc finger protein [Candidatus Hodarchaeales archaeon]